MGKDPKGVREQLGVGDRCFYNRLGALCRAFCHDDRGKEQTCFHRYLRHLCLLPGLNVVGCQHVLEEASHIQ
jgi:hypothetical protein